jgi:hypothetical protein
MRIRFDLQPTARKRGSRQDLFDNVAVEPGEAEVAALESCGEFGKIPSRHLTRLSDPGGSIFLPRVL